VGFDLRNPSAARLVDVGDNLYIHIQLRPPCGHFRTCRGSVGESCGRFLAEPQGSAILKNSVMDTRWKRLSFAGALRSGHWILAFPINIGGHLYSLNIETARAQSPQMQKEIND